MDEKSISHVTYDNISIDYTFSRLGICKTVLKNCAPLAGRNFEPILFTLTQVATIEI